MLSPDKMKAGDFTCLLCGSRLELKLADLVIGDNSGACPCCGEPFRINLTKDEMELLWEAEEERPARH